MSVVVKLILSHPPTHNSRLEGSCSYQNEEILSPSNNCSYAGLSLSQWLAQLKLDGAWHSSAPACSRLLLTFFAHNFSLQLQFTTVVHNSFSQLLFEILFPNFIQSFCSQILPTFFSKLLFTTHLYNSVQNFCSELLLIAFAQNSCSRERERERFITSDIVVTILPGICPTVKTKIHRSQNKHNRYN